MRPDWQTYALLLRACQSELGEGGGDGRGGGRGMPDDSAAGLLCSLVARGAPSNTLGLLSSFTRFLFDSAAAAHTCSAHASPHDAPTHQPTQVPPLQPLLSAVQPSGTWLPPTRSLTACRRMACSRRACITTRACPSTLQEGTCRCGWWLRRLAAAAAEGGEGGGRAVKRLLQVCGCVSSTPLLG